jgi:hypothetical protein
MGRNAFLEQQKAAQRECLNIGVRCGRQQIMDLLSLVLRDPEIMGKDTFGKDRLIKVVDGISDYIDKYQPAWDKSDETDYYQKKLDDALVEAYGEALQDSFHERYPYAPEYDYVKGKWKR